MRSTRTQHDDAKRSRSAVSVRVISHVFIVLSSVVILTLPYTNAHADVVIRDDYGGPLGSYLVRYNNLKQSGQRVVIDGNCYSACTAVMGIIVPERLCITGNAAFGFHAALAPNHLGLLDVDRDATRLLYSLYPPRIRRWLDRNGGLRWQTVVLRGAELARLVPRCR